MNGSVLPLSRDGGGALANRSAILPMGALLVQAGRLSADDAERGVTVRAKALSSARRVGRAAESGVEAASAGFQKAEAVAEDEVSGECECIEESGDDADSVECHAFPYLREQEHAYECE